MVYAFNVLDFKGCAELVFLSKKYNVPLIIQVSQKIALQTDVKMWSKIFNFFRKYYRADVKLNLDHATCKDLIYSCIMSGWDMIMFDGGKLDYRENLKFTKRIVCLAHKKGVLVEGELGAIGDYGDEIFLDSGDLSLVKNFVNETGVDFLALPFGTKHGLEKNFKINYGLIEKVHRLISKPLVLHGGSGLSCPMIKKCIVKGISKINFSTEVKCAYFNAHRRYKTGNLTDFLKVPYQFEIILKEELEKLFQKKIKFIRSRPQNLGPF